MKLLYIKLSFCYVACHGGDSFEDRTAIVFRKVSGEGEIREEESFSLSPSYQRLRRNPRGGGGGSTAQGKLPNCSQSSISIVITSLNI